MADSSRPWILGAALAGIAGGLAIVRHSPPPEGVSDSASSAEVSVLDEPIAPVPLSVDLDERKVVLGERLFRDARLSSDGTVSCSTCHDLESAGADSRRFSLGVGGAVGTINTPTVFNSGLNFRQFWDGRAPSLEAQIDGPLLDPLEMGSDWERVLTVIASDVEYVARFDALYDALDPDAVRDAIATFERSLITPGAPIDRHLRGEEGALSEAALAGYVLFKDLGCVACHQGVNVGGNMLQRVGVAAARPEEREQPPLMKVPGLRNVALTAPYFRDGSAATLEDAVRVMARAQLGIELEDDMVTSLIAFLESLTGDRPR